MKVGFAGRWSPLEKNAWSGTYFYAYQAIKRNFDVQYFKYKWPWYIREQLIFQKQIQKLRSRKVAVEFLRGYARWFSKQLEKELRQTKLDVLFIPGAPQLIAYCKTSVPIIYMADATFQQLQGYYDSFSNLAPYNILQGIELDRLAFNNATHCMLASDWAKQSVVSDYYIPENKITVQPLGANLDFIPAVSELKNEKNKICQLLFLGVDWDRKGGQIALDTFYTLQKNGMQVQLTIIGCRPPLQIKDKNVTVIPFINKNIKEEAQQLYNILLQTDFLLLPTRAECAGVVFCEASAFGIPSITTDTGGVRTYVENGINGFTLPISDGAGAYAEKILDLYNNDDTYRQLCISSRNKFETELNWDSWGKSFFSIAENILAGNKM
jgi:glycosyltransferase involved in cell wall biosynthesis